MLEDVELYQSFVSSEIISSTQMKVMGTIIEERGPALYHNEENTTMYCEISQKCDDVKKDVVEVS